MKNPLCNHAREGFTLLETMITVVIGGIILAMALPNFVSINESHRIREAASTLESGMIKARSIAVTRNEDVRMSVFGGGRLYIMQRDTDGDGTFETWTEWKWLPQDVVMSAVSFGGASSVVFNGQGIPSSSGTITLKSGTQFRQLDLAPGSGAVMVSIPNSPQGDGDQGGTGY